MTRTRLVRRSNFLVSALDSHGVAAAARSDADAITIDLGELVGNGEVDRARGGLLDSLDACRRSGADLFVRVDREALGSVVESFVDHDLAGAVVTGVRTAGEVAAVAELLAEKESECARDPGSIEVILSIESPAALWELKDLLGVTSRVRQAWLDEPGLCASMEIVQGEAFDQLAYARGRFICECTALGVQPVGTGPWLCFFPPHLSSGEIGRRARNARNLGFKGIICVDDGWVVPVNSALTPSIEQVDYAHRVRQAFAAGLEAGTAAVPLDGRMVDVPVDKSAQATLELAAMCAERDREKAEERGRSRGRQRMR